MSTDSEVVQLPIVASKGEQLIEQVLVELRASTEIQQSGGDIDVLTKFVHDRLQVFLEDLGQYMANDLDHTREIARLSLSMSKRAEELEEQSSSQADQLVSAVQEIETLSVTVEHNSSVAQFTAETAESSAEAAGKGHEIVNQLVQKIKEVDEVFAQLKVAMQDLEVSSRAIGKIVSSIEAIATQTNLLSLNAAIEAARAGEQGKGFAVVASEVRSLAKQTSESTKEIETLVQTIQGQVANVMECIVEGTDRVNEENQFIDSTTEGLTEILESSVQTQSLVMQIAASSEQQTDINRKLVKTVREIASMAAEEIDKTRKILRIADQITALSNLMTWDKLQFEGTPDIAEIFHEHELQFLDSLQSYGEGLQ